jgi:hypothetical protein
VSGICSPLKLALQVGGEGKATHRSCCEKDFWIGVGGYGNGRGFAVMKSRARISRKSQLSISSKFVNFCDAH